MLTCIPWLPGIVSHHGSFAIRQGDWKLILCPGSGDWHYPTPSDIKKGNLDLPPLQLYNLKEDIGETTNLVADKKLNN